MGDLTKNLSRHEFTCECGCGLMFADYETVNVLQGTCDHFRQVYSQRIMIDITGPDRCREHNETVQKIVNPDYISYSSKSTHIYAGGIDFKIFRYECSLKIQISSKEIADYLDKKYPNKYCIIIYHNRNHFDPRKIKFRKDKRRKKL